MAQVSGQKSSGAPQVFKKDISFERLGIGGLDEQFQNIFRRAFASRVFPPALISRWANVVG